MNLEEFEKNSLRADKAGNDNSHFFSTHFSVKVAYIFYKAKVSPNGVTFLFLLVGVGVSIALYQQYGLLAYLLWRCHIILDMADGSLARATKVFSKSAIGFDRSNHIVINTLLLFSSSQHIESFLLTGCLIISFYLYYFFSRNYLAEKQSSSNFPMSINLIKNIVGLEGYVLATCLISMLRYPEVQYELILFYTISFFILYLIKLKKFISAVAD